MRVRSANEHGERARRGEMRREARLALDLTGLGAAFTGDEPGLKRGCPLNRPRQEAQSPEVKGIVPRKHANTSDKDRGAIATMLWSDPAGAARPVPTSQDRRWTISRA